MINALLAKVKEGAGLIWYEQEQNCLLCGLKSKFPEGICNVCRQEFFLPEAGRCRSCGKIMLNQKNQCRDCTEGKGPQGLTKVTSLGHYAGAWKEFIHKVKYKGQPYLLLYLAEYMTDWVIRQLPPPDLIVPVPLYQEKLARRGYNQAEVIASILGRGLGIAVEEALERTRDTTPQTTLGRRARIENLSGAIAMKPGSEIDSQVIWLVDDVVTTGTTLAECTAVLRKNGAKEVYGFCLGSGKEK